MRKLAIAVFIGLCLVATGSGVVGADCPEGEVCIQSGPTVDNGDTSTNWLPLIGAGVFGGVIGLLSGAFIERKSSQGLR